MSDLKDRMQERWNQRRKKSYNWIKPVLMLIALFAILYIMQQFNKSEKLSDLIPVKPDSIEVSK